MAINKHSTNSINPDDDLTDPFIPIPEGRRPMSKTVKNTIIGAIITFLLTGAGVWISGVNATQDKTIILEAILPRVDKQLQDVNIKMDGIDKRLSRIEGKLEGGSK